MRTDQNKHKKYNIILDYFCKHTEPDFWMKNRAFAKHKASHNLRWEIILALNLINQIEIYMCC